MLELRSHQPTAKICFQVVPVERPGLVDVTTWVMLGSSFTMVNKLTFAFSFGITSVQQKSNAIAHNPLKDTKILLVSTHFLSCFESWSSFQVLLLAKATSHYRRRSHRLKKYQILRFKIAILHTKVTRQIIIRFNNCYCWHIIKWLNISSEIDSSYQQAEKGDNYPVHLGDEAAAPLGGDLGQGDLCQGEPPLPLLLLLSKPTPGSGHSGKRWKQVANSHLSLIFDNNYFRNERRTYCGRADPYEKSESMLLQEF